jgi:hypothetical protein
MTEKEWLGCKNPQQMVGEVLARASKRKLRLFAVACCRRIWALISEGASREAVVTAEQHADGLAADAAREEALAEVVKVIEAFQERADWAREGTAYLQSLGERQRLCAAWAAASTVEAAVEEDLVKICAWAMDAVAPGWFIGRGVDEKIIRKDRQQEQAAQCALLRCLCGNPFRPPPCLHPSLLARDGGTLEGLAWAAYEQRLLPSGHLDPARLAVLADALEEAGADSALLDHLRGPGPHTRGCWVVDWALGKH